MKQWWAVSLGVTMIALIVWQWPEIERYRRMSSM